MNAANLGWVAPPARAAMLPQMAQSGVRVIRTAFTPPFAATIDAMEAAQRAGMATLLNVNLDFAPFYPPDVPSGRFGAIGILPLSRFDPVWFRQMLLPLLAEIDRRGIRLAGIELGNEINWAGGNADISAVFHGPGNGVLANLPDHDRIAEGYRRYVRGLAVLHDWRGTSTVNQAIPIIAGALSDVTPDQARQLKFGFVDAAESRALLHDFGADQYADGYSLHFYPDPGADPLAPGAPLPHAARFCTELASGKGCWFTEWGVAAKDTGCPAQERARPAIVATVRRRLSALAASGHLAGEFYFDWSGAGPFSIWRCGGLTGAGVALLR